MATLTSETILHKYLTDSVTPIVGESITKTSFFSTPNFILSKKNTIVAGVLTKEYSSTSSSGQTLPTTTVKTPFRFRFGWWR